MFRKQALEHYRSDFSETETPFFISTKKTTLLFVGIAISLFFFFSLSLISITIPLSVEGFINTKNKVEFTTTNGTSYLQNLDNFAETTFVVYKQTDSIISGHLENVETAEGETSVFLTINQNSSTDLNQLNGEAVTLKLITRQKLLNLFIE